MSKKLTPETFDRFLKGRTLVGLVPLKFGGIGLLFNGSKIVDLRTKELLDPAESVAAIGAAKRQLETMGYATFVEPAATAPLAAKSAADFYAKPEVIEAGGMESELPEFVMDYKATGGLSAPDRAARPVKTITDTEEGWE